MDHTWIRSSLSLRRISQGRVSRQLSLHLTTESVDSSPSDRVDRNDSKDRIGWTRVRLKSIFTDGLESSTLFSVLCHRVKYLVELAKSRTVIIAWHTGITQDLKAVFKTSGAAGHAHLLLHTEGTDAAHTCLRWRSTWLLKINL